MEKDLTYLNLNNERKLTSTFDEALVEEITFYRKNKNYKWVSVIEIKMQP